MHIIKIVIENFKSYKNRTVIEGFSPGLNTILGFNGSGKSTIIDALQFVLTDRYNNLTQDERQALFSRESGDQVPNRQRQAIVELTIDNTDRKMQYLTNDNQIASEIILTRICGPKRDEYSINNTQISRAQLMTLLQPLGLGTNNLSFVEQNSISALLSMGDSGRLDLLTQAAGVKHYDERRAETIRIMYDTDRDLNDVDLLLQSISSKLGELNVERSRLLLYEQLSQRKRNIDKRIYNIKYNKLGVDIKNIRQQLDNEDIIEQKRIQARNDEADAAQILSNCEAMVAETTMLLASAEDQLRIYTSDMDSLNTRKNDLLTVVSQLSALISTTQNAIDTSQKKLSNIKESIKDKNDDINILNIENDLLIQRRDTLLGLYDVEQIESLRSQLDILINNIANDEKTLDDIKTKIDTITLNEDNTSKKLDDIDTSLKTATDKALNIDNNIKDIYSKMNTVQHDITTLTNQKTQLLNDHDNITRQSMGDNVSNTRHNNNNNNNNTNPRAGIIQVDQLIDRYRIWSQLSPEQRVLYNNTNNDNTTPDDNDLEWVKGVYGPISTLCEWSTELDVAIQAVFGPRLHFIVVDTPSTALRLRKYITSGSITVIPATALHLSHYDDHIVPKGAPVGSVPLTATTTTTTTTTTTSSDTTKSSKKRSTIQQNNPNNSTSLTTTLQPSPTPPEVFRYFERISSRDSFPLMRYITHRDTGWSLEYTDEDYNSSDKPSALPSDAPSQQHRINHIVYQHVKRALYSIIGNVYTTRSNDIAINFNSKYGITCVSSTHGIVIGRLGEIQGGYINKKNIINNDNINTYLEHRNKIIRTICDTAHKQDIYKKYNDEYNTYINKQISIRNNIDQLYTERNTLRQELLQYATNKISLQYEYDTMVQHINTIQHTITNIRTRIALADGTNNTTTTTTSTSSTSSDITTTTKGGNKNKNKKQQQQATQSSSSSQDNNTNNDSIPLDLLQRISSYHNISTVNKRHEHIDKLLTTTNNDLQQLLLESTTLSSYINNNLSIQLHDALTNENAIQNDIYNISTQIDTLQHNINTHTIKLHDIQQLLSKHKKQLRKAKTHATEVTASLHMLNNNTNNTTNGSSSNNTNSNTNDNIPNSGLQLRLRLQHLLSQRAEITNEIHSIEQAEANSPLAQLMSQYDDDTAEQTLEAVLALSAKETADILHAHKQQQKRSKQRALRAGKEYTGGTDPDQIYAEKTSNIAISARAYKPLFTDDITTLDLTSLEILSSALYDALLKQPAVSQSIVMLYMTTRETYNSLLVRRLELKQARQQILLLVSNLDKRKTRELQHTFARVNHEFKVILKQLWNNVQGSLVLIRAQNAPPLDDDDNDDNDTTSNKATTITNNNDDDDDIEPDVDDIIKTPVVQFSGIGINVESNGQMMRLAAVSGGQGSQLAVAILLALQRVVGAVFCILDEPDANMDTEFTRTLLSVLATHAHPIPIMNSFGLPVQSQQHTQVFFTSFHTQLAVRQADAVYKVSLLHGHPVVEQQDIDLITE